MKSPGRPEDPRRLEKETPSSDPAAVEPSSSRQPSDAQTSLTRGDLLPRMQPGLSASKSSHPCNSLAADLALYEAPGINTLVDGDTNLVLSEALGANVMDTTGNRYIDLVSGFGVALLGHRNPSILQSVADQSGKLLHGLGDVYANQPRIELARALCKRAPFANAKVYFAVSGADAVEIALKTAVLATSRKRVLAFDPGYHGTTLGALQVSSRPEFREPFAAHGGTHVTRLPFGCKPRDLRQALGTEDFAAVLFEPVVGREGVLFPPKGWIQSLLEIAKATGTVSIADEIFTGFRRTGPWFAHCKDSSSTPADLICCGKALGGGLPIGAVIGQRQLFSAWDHGGEALHTGTFVGHPLACAAALSVLRELEQPWITDRLVAIERAFSSLAAATTATARATSSVGPAKRPALHVRGEGALWAIECETRCVAKRLQQEALSRGLLVLAGGPEGRVVQLVPPLPITDQQLDYVIKTLADLLDLPV